MRRFVDLSTTGAVMAQRIFEGLSARDIVQIDSPVSGGVRGAERSKAHSPSWSLGRAPKSLQSSRR